MAVRAPRAAGVLLHVTSLPGPLGIGDLGPAARRFVDFLAAARQGLWQILPLGPTGFGDSPYQCFSAFAGNPLLISPELLVEEGLLDAGDLRGAPSGDATRVDFAALIPWKRALLARAARRFAAEAGQGGAAREYERFCSEHAWLEDFALFMALKEAHRGAPWSAWGRDIARRAPGALERWRARLAAASHEQRFSQFVFHRQWRALRRHAAQRAVRLIGDLPIFVAHDSADVWANRELFSLDERGRPTVVAGVPPDYFSATGQLWGNPLYRWDVLAGRGYDWWIERLRGALELVDVVRIDHFIGFTRYWEVPGTAQDATQGRWVPGPGAALCRALREALGGLPIIAEDLGEVTPEVEALRDAFELPGMRVLQFAFGGDADNPFLPHNYPARCVAYTGTHDNDTALGWFAAAPAEERSFAQRYLARSGEDFAYDAIRAVMSSVAERAIVPVQDVLALGSEARMNRPGVADGNWAWRLAPDALGDWHAARLREMAELYGRAARPA